MRPLCRFVLVAVAAAFFGSQGVMAAEKPLRSTVTAVTVYSDRALVTRTAKDSLGAGTHNLLFAGLPAGLLDESIKVTGESAVRTKIMDVQLRNVFADTIPEARAKELNRRLATLRNQGEGLREKRMLMQMQINTVDSLRANYARSVATANQKAMTEEWEKLLQFVERKRTEYADRSLSLRIEMENLQRSIQALEQEIQNSNAVAQNAQKSVTVVLNVPTAAAVKLEISYIILGAQWEPLYEARGVSGTASLQLVYTGQISQSTGEDWTNVDLTLSTAKPALGSAPPELSRWELYTGPARRPIAYAPPTRASRSSGLKARPRQLIGTVEDAGTGEPLIGASVSLVGTNRGASTDTQGMFRFDNLPDGMYTAKVSFVGYQTVQMSQIDISSRYGSVQNFLLPAEGVTLGTVEITGERPMVSKSATNSVRMDMAGASLGVRGGRTEGEVFETVTQETALPEAAPTSAVFHLASRPSIPSDDQPHKVGILVEELPVTFSYESAPKLVPAAYLTGRGKNATEYPFLAGPVNVFFENSFIATSHFNTVMPNDSFAVNFGIDEAIRVERKQIRRFTEQIGTFTSKTRVMYQYEIRLENLRKSPVELTVRDQVPVSRTDDIEVEVQSPSKEMAKPDPNGIITWRCTLGAGEKRVLPIAFTVEFPRDKQVNGLE